VLLTLFLEMFNYLLHELEIYVNSKQTNIMWKVFVSVLTE